MWWNSYQIKLNIGSLRKFFVGSNISLMDLWIVALGLHRWRTKRIQYIHGKKNQDFKLSSRCHSQISSQIQEVSVLVAVWLIELVDCPSWESEANLWWGLVSYFVDFYHRPKVCGSQDCLDHFNPTDNETLLIRKYWLDFVCKQTNQHPYCLCIDIWLFILLAIFVKWHAEASTE